ncbi:MAG TPA: amidase [Rubellimicrobium sp.]|nr:amidase [Rubellimicrobium sp.]
MTPEDYSRLDALALASLVAGREVSATEVTEAAIASIEALNPSLNAVVLLRFEDARADAALLDAEGPGERPLAGIPFLLKDVNLYASDMPTRFASRFFADARPGEDSTLVRRWREAGLVTLGKSNTPEFAGDFVTEPLLYGPCLNPWDAGVTVGGSSGGAAVAVASGMVPLAHGTDLGGSIRIPAACCGVFGFKPSVGLNPLGPHWEEIASGLDSDHVLSRSVRDSAAALDATAGPDTGTRLGRVPPPGGFLAGLDGARPRLRIGVAMADATGRRAGPSQVAAVERTARLLEGLGHRLEPYAFPPAAQPEAWFDSLWTVDVALLVEKRSQDLGRGPREDELEPYLWAALDHARGLSATDWLRARLAMKQAAVAILGSMRHLDAVLSPTLGEDPPALGVLNFAANGSDLAAWSARGYAFAPFVAAANLTGQPAASCPVMVDARGLPVGVQVAGRPGDDMLVLGLAREIEQATEWPSSLAALQGRLAAP